MKPFRWLTLALLAAVPISARAPAAVAPAAQEKTAKATDPLTELQDEYEALQIGYRSRLKEVASDEAKRTALLEEMQKATKAIFDRGAKFLQDDPRSALAVRTRIWFATSHYETSERKSWMTKVLAEDIQSPLIVELIPALDARATPDGDGPLQTIADRSPHADVRGIALFALASNLVERIKDAQQLEEGGKAAQAVRRRIGEERATELTRTGAKALQDRQLALYERVVKDHAELTDERGRKYSARAQGAINQIKFLQIGMIAPDIVGEDVFGKTFKLSEYRGKIVVLDFWGHW